MPEVQDKPLHELLSRSMVDIYVGPNNTHWVLHEKLLCHHSPFFRRIFYSKSNNANASKTYGLPDEEDATFKTFVGWLYSNSLPVPREEADLTVAYDLYLLSEKLEIPRLSQDVLQVVREWYKFSDTYPGLRRVQYIYANTEEGSPMRVMLVHAVARMLVLGDSGKGDGVRLGGIPKHWDKALRKNGQLAVDIIRAVQEWGIEEERIPDAREEGALGEDMVDDEGVGIDEDVEVEVDDQEQGQEQEQEQENDDEGVEQKNATQQQDDVDEGAEADEEHDDDAEQHDSSEDTVVESPTEEKKMSLKQQRQTPKKNKSAGNLEKLPLNEVPNAVSLEDYGTLGAH